MEHRTYDEKSQIWGWSELSVDAKIFPDIEEAESHVTALKLQGEKKVYPFIFSKIEQERHIIKLANRHKTPEEIFSELEKRGLA